MGEWINDLDMVPAPFEKVLRYGLIVSDLSTMRYIDFAYRDDNGFWCIYAGTDSDWQITHWMPLPAPPEES